MIENKYFEALGKPFPVSDVGWKIQQTNKEKTRGMVVAYVDARAISDRFDKVVGQNMWKDSYEQWHSYTKNAREKGQEVQKVIQSQLCTISIYDSERKEWIGKTDGAENTEFESIKGGLSDAFKRAAVKWNVGRYVYNMEPVWVNLEDKYGRPVIAEGEEENLIKRYNKTVAELFGKEALGAENKGDNTQQKSRSEDAQNPDAKQDIYEIKNIKVQGEGQNMRSALVLSKGGNNSTVFMFGSDPKLKKGTKLVNVREKKKKNNIGEYVILEAYDIAA